MLKRKKQPMESNKKFILFIFISLLFFSCVSKKIAYTSDIQKEYKIPEDKLKKIQFYTSSEIILVQTKQEGDVSISNGKILIIKNKDIERIVIKKNTPCILEEIIDESKFIFSFEYGENKILLFGNNNGTGCFSLMSRENWTNGIGIIPYGNKNYITTNGAVFLTVEAKKLNKLKAKERIVTGRKI